MSKPLTFFNKIKLFRLYLKEQQNGVVVSCPYCEGTNIRFLNQKQYPVADTMTYRSIYKCNDCRAYCDNVQEWKK